MDGCLGGAGARPALAGERDQPGAGVARVGGPLDVSAGFELVHELGGGLPGHAEVPGQFGDGGAAGGEPGEGEATVVEGRFCRGRDVLQFLMAAAGR